MTKETDETAGLAPQSDAAAGVSDTGYYRCHVFCCTNTRPEGHKRGSCEARGAVPLRNYLKARVKELGLPGVRVNIAGCLDRCELGPVMVIYPEGIWYSYSTREDVEEILQRHLVGGERVERLVLRRDDETPPPDRGLVHQA